MASEQYGMWESDEKSQYHGYFDYNNDPFAEGARKYQQELIEKAMQEYLTKCIQNNHHCAHCIHNHNNSCVFAIACFATDQKFYQDEE